MIFRFYIFLIIILGSNEVHAQNLIRNAGFEKHNPWTYFSLFFNLGNLTKWNNPNRSTPDYHQGEFNFMGQQKPHSGEYYTGIRFGYKTTLGQTSYDHLEYIQNKLKTTLLNNKLYCIALYTSRAEDVFFATSSIDVTLTKEKIKDNEEDRILPTNNYIRLTSSDDSLLKESKGWMYICGLYLAQGGEKYITIGKFSPNFDLLNIDKRKRVTRGFTSSYYYIDDVSLVEISDSSACSCNYIKPTILKDTFNMNRVDSNSFDFKNITIGESIKINHIYFAVDKSELLPESFKALNALSQSLKDYSTLRLEITGHTDNTGDEQKNLVLSKERAEAVVQYLVRSGISIDRLIAVGHGSLFPIASNDTEQGRIKNRRVEFSVLSK